MTVGDMHEYAARNLLSPRHLNKVVELLFKERGVVAEKRKLVISKESRRNAKKPRVAAPNGDEERYPETQPLI